jgi:hypothetical protein
MAVSTIDPNGLNIGQYGNRNLIINGAMQVAQRGTSFTSAGTQYTLDRFKTEQGGIDNALINVTQDSDAPSGFAKSLKVTVATAETAVADNEYMGLVHIIEAQDLQQLDYNTAAAKSVTLSFWVKASVTGVYAVANYVDDGIRIIGATYTINSANTWEYKTITYAGDTAGLLDDNNGAGFYLYWYFAAGPDRTSSSNTSWGAYVSTKLAYGQEVQLIETVNATWQITGVQLEVGDTATPFEHRSYGQELALCQRYYRLIGTYGDPYATQGNYILNDVTYNNENRMIIPYLNPPMRTTPSVTHVNWSNGGTGALTEFSAGTIRSQTNISEVSPFGGGYAQFDGNFGNPARYVAVFDAEL